MDKPDFYELLNKANRFEGPYVGNRNPWMASHMYFALIGRKSRLLEWVVLSALGNGKSQLEVDKTEARTRAIVDKRRAQSYAYACMKMAGKGMRHNATRVLAQMVLYGWHTGYCCASQRSIGIALGLSRECVNRWVKRLRNAGLLALVGYDARGVFEWRQRAFIKWCLVFDMGFKWGREKHHTNPISAFAFSGSVVAVQQL